MTYMGYVADATSGLVASVEARKQSPTGNALNVQIGVNDIIIGLPVILDYDQHQIHEGETWTWNVYVSNLASGSSRDIVFTVPNITIPGGVNAAARTPHWRYMAEANDLCTILLYEGPTVTGGTGTAGTPINLERNGTYTCQTTILDAPTITAVGTLLDTEYMLITGSGSATADNQGLSVNEWILKNNTSYLFRITSGAAGLDVHVKFIWYEDLGV